MSADSAAIPPTEPPPPLPLELKSRMADACFTFRGYNITNQGRSHELLVHPTYGSTMRELLAEASAICSEAIGRRVDLVGRVRARTPSTLGTFPEDVSMIVAIEVAQVRLLESVFGVHYGRARMAFGYSLGELAALICGGVYRMEDVLRPLLMMAGECAELARDVTMGIVFSRGPALELDAIGRLCVELNREGQGVIGMSAHLAPNSILLLGQGDTVARFKDRMHQAMPDPVHLRTNDHRWPPLHTPILWERNIPNRGARLMHTAPRGLSVPHPPVLSLVTGKSSYSDYNSRELLNRWIDHPQRLWDAVYGSLVEGIDTYIHVGPEANLIPATFKRISDNVRQQTSARTWGGYGMRAISGMVNRPWLGRLLHERTALLRAPFVEHVMLEDWLLAMG
jgi:[acyl-carrier-protein] S-malonyltransferase